MPNPTRLLRRWPHIDEAQIEAARSITLARLSAIVDAGPATAEDAASVDAVAADMAVPTETAAAYPAAGIEPGVQRTRERARVAIVATTALVPIEERNGVGSVVAWRLDPDDTIALPATIVPVLADHGSSSPDPDGGDLPAADVREAASPLTTESPTVREEALGARGASSRQRPPRTARSAASRPRRAAAPRPTLKAAVVPLAVIASCPYCALLLEPPPEADRRCVRCRQRIIVKRVEGRAVYLTEAAVLVFEAERRRIASTGRWTRDRERWLKLAASVGAPAGRIARLERAVLSDALVADARALYETTVERLVRTARRDHHWDDAARLRRDEALALYRIARSPVPPPDDVAALHREGALATLHGLGEIAREAELIGAGCCDSCRADDGRHFRISRELREPRLPHPGCPKGLCRCRWELTAQDRNLVGGYLRRHTRPNRVAPSA